MKDNNYIFIFLIFIFYSCQTSPKEIQSSNENYKTDTESNSTGIFSDNSESNQSSSSVNSTNASVNGLHTVKVVEVLPTEKYVYLSVEEGDDRFWIATSKQDVNVGEIYVYKGGLLKTNFESKEYSRVFNKVYLVSSIMLVNHQRENESSLTTNKPSESKSQRKSIEGSIKISDIVRSPETFAGKLVQVSGTCVKLNANIMERNWIHLQDGSQDDYDFVLTSDVAIPEGHFVTLAGILILDKDFGAGYRYDILIENAEIVK